MKIIHLALLVISLGCSALPFATRAQEFERINFNNAGLKVDLGVGLWAAPMPMDYDGDGKTDLVVVCTGRPFNGIYLFRNTGNEGIMPVFEPPVRVDKAIANLQLSYVDGQARVLSPGREYRDFAKNLLKSPINLPVPKEELPKEARIRANQWRYVDYDGDGVQDLVVGIEDWNDYGWDDAFNSQGQWTNGPLHGYVYLLHNHGTNATPAYDAPTKLKAADREIDGYGMPSPCFADFDRDGDLDLICTDFVGGFTFYQNTGTRTAPTYAARQPLRSEKGALHLQESCMPQMVAFDWDHDGNVDLLVGQEDGRVALMRNTGRVVDGAPIFDEPRFFQQQAEDLKFGVLTTPVVFDWDGDDKPDIIAGNAGGFIGFIRNLDGGNPPRWAAPEYLQADGKVLRILAGQNGSIQGPAESQWGYTTISVTDWDGDGLPDIIANSSWGKVVWFRNVGTRTAPKLAASQPVQVEWPGPAPKPSWFWWEPKDNELATQWRTTPLVRDLNGDGLNDLISLDRDGFLTFFQRERKDGALKLLPPRHIFRMAPSGPSVFDNNQATMTFPGPDQQNVVAGLDAHGQLTFYESQPNGDRKNKPTKHVDRAGDPVYADEAYRDSGPALRLTGGWAGRSGRRKFTMADWDGDGKLDLLVNSTNVTFLRNVATRPDQFVFQDMGPLGKTVLAGHDTSPTTCDFQGDGVPDLLVGAEDGHFYFLKNPRHAAASESK